MEGVKLHLKEDETDIICDKCGRQMVVKVGRYGKFIACPGYPECKNIIKYVEKRVLSVLSAAAMSLSSVQRQKEFFTAAPTIPSVIL